MERFQVDLAGMVDLLSRHLYSGPQVYLRELIQNAVDAMNARRIVDKDAPAKVRIITEEANGQATLVVRDTGIGLTGAQAKELLATIGRSSKRNLDINASRGASYIGQFGIGLLSAFMVADEIEVTSRSVESGAVPIIWRGKSDGTFNIEERPDLDIEVGSTVSLTATRGSEHWLNEETVITLIKDYASFLPYDIAIRAVVDGENKWRRLSHPQLPWTERNETSSMRSERLETFCQETFGWKPLGVIPLEVPIVGLSGVAFIVPQTVARGSGSHRVYVKRMLLGNRIDTILPEWAFFVRAVMNVEHVTPTASREDLHDDEILWEIREALGTQLKEWLIASLSHLNAFSQKFIETHQLALRAAALSDPAILELCSRTLPYETTNGVLTLDEARNNGELIYTATTEAFRRINSVARAQGLTVVNAGYVYDLDIITELGRRAGWSIRQLEGHDLVQLLGLPDALRLAQADGALTRARALLEEEDTEVILRNFSPEDLPAILLVDSQAERDRALHRETVESPDLWGGLLSAIDTHTNLPARTLVLNDSSAVIQMLIGAVGETIFDSALHSLYLSALMLSGEGLGGQQARALGYEIGNLLEAALRDRSSP